MKHPSVADTHVSVCRQFIAEWCTQSESALDADTQTRYIDALTPLLTPLPSDRWEAVITCYHQDHVLVASLRDSGHPNHAEAWGRWCAQVIAILRHKGHDWARDSSLDIDDLAQVARQALASALPTFSYHSRFSTWAYTVIARSTRDHLRAARAQRRSGDVRSLEAMPMSAHPLEPHQPHEEATNARLLAEQIAAVLRAHPDRRLARVFLLSAVEGQTSAEIGKLVHLHESRVRALLKQARDYLRADPGIQAWHDHHTEPE